LQKSNGLILNLTWKCKTPRISKIIKKGTNLEDSYFLISKIISDTVIKPAYRHQWNRNMGPEINLHIYGQLNSMKEEVF
jgi:hypothetical protein